MLYLGCSTDALGLGGPGPCASGPSCGVARLRRTGRGSRCTSRCVHRAPTARHMYMCVRGLRGVGEAERRGRTYERLRTAQAEERRRQEMATGQLRMRRGSEAASAVSSAQRVAAAPTRREAAAAEAHGEAYERGAVARTTRWLREIARRSQVHVKQRESENSIKAPSGADRVCSWLSPPPRSGAGWLWPWSMVSRGCGLTSTCCWDSRANSEVQEVLARLTPVSGNC